MEKQTTELLKYATKRWEDKQESYSMETFRAFGLKSCITTCFGLKMSVSLRACDDQRIGKRVYIKFDTGAFLTKILGRAVAQAVSRWLPTAAARVLVRAACGVCGGQRGTGAGFLRVLQFPLPMNPPISPSS
jgi:hypothetical protein